MRRLHALLGVEKSRDLFKEETTTAVGDFHEDRKGSGASTLKRAEIFERDGYRCVYCGGVFDAGELSIDHVQPRMRGGDGSGGNVVTACRACNTAKAGRRLSEYLAENPVARRNFFLFARYVWARHLKAVAEELARQGAVERPADFVEGVRLLRSSEAIAKPDVAKPDILDDPAAG